SPWLADLPLWREEAYDQRVANRAIADGLVNLVGGWVRQIGIQKAALMAAVQQVLAERGGAGAGIAAPAQFRRCIDRRDMDTVRRAPAKSSITDHAAFVFPDAQAA